MVTICYYILNNKAAQPLMPALSLPACRVVWLDNVGAYLIAFAMASIRFLICSSGITPISAFIVPTSLLSFGYSVAWHSVNKRAYRQIKPSCQRTRMIKG